MCLGAVRWHRMNSMLSIFLAGVAVVVVAAVSLFHFSGAADR